MKKGEKTRNRQSDGWLEISQRLMELKLKQNNSTNFPDAEKTEKLTRIVSQELVDVLTVIIENCDQILMKLKREKPLYSHIEEIKRTAEHARYLNDKLLSLNRDNYLTQIDTNTKNDKKLIDQD